MNRAVGFLLGIVCGIPQLPWSRGHAFHHRHNGDWERYQGPSALITTEAYGALSPAQQRLVRPASPPADAVSRRVLLSGDQAPRGHAAGSCLDAAPDRGSAATRHWHSPEEFRDLALNNLAVVVPVGRHGLVDRRRALLVIYSPVMACAAAIFICIFFVQHNFPGSYAHATEGWSEMAGCLEGTSDLDLPAVFNWFSADIGCHAIHHLSPAIPNYRLRACQPATAPAQRRATAFAGRHPRLLQLHPLGSPGQPADHHRWRRLCPFRRGSLIKAGVARQGGPSPHR